MALSEMMRRYLETKEKYKDCVLFYRLGDFYEMFFDDAIKVSRMLDLTLTGKDCGLEERAPMCGIPFHAADTYISRLVEMGEKVAICEQLSDPKEAGRNLVERDVIRVVTAGTLIDDTMLDESKNNYIACAFKNAESIALAWTDITTGEFFVSEYKTETAMDDVIGQMLRLSVAEVICNDDMLLASKDRKEIKHGNLPAFSVYVGWAFNEKNAERNLLEQFHAVSLSEYKIAGKENCITAAGALLEYLKETQKRFLQNISSITVVDREEYVVLDSIAVRNLELIKNNAEGKKYGSLLWLLDRTQTSMGARLLTRMILSPLKQKDKIDERLDGVEELISATVPRVGLFETLKEIKDLERLAGKISNGNLTPRDCESIRKSCEALPSLKFLLSGFSSAVLSEISKSFPDLSALCDLLKRSIREDPPVSVKDGGFVREGYNAELDELRQISGRGNAIVKDIEVREKERTGIKNLKIGYNKVFGYFIEISNSFLDKVPEDYIRKQTLTTGERFITPELKEIEEKILTSSEKALKLEQKIFSELMQVLSGKISDLLTVSASVALLDCLVAFANLSKERKYTRPKMVDEDLPLSIVEGRHPVVEALSRERFVPNDTLLDESENRCLIITGPNMAGKSTYMRQVALITIMAHIGCFVPAKSAQIPVVDRIFTRVGASDNLIFDQSTFMVEMSEVASILLHATKNSLLILDEVGRGTSTYDGLSIAWSVIEFLTEHIKAKTLFATHYHELTELENKMDGVKNYKVTVKEMNGTVVFLRKIMRGGANRSFGIEVASLAGVPKEVTSRAKVILKSLEKSELSRNMQTVSSETEEETEEIAMTEVERILSETDINTLSPMQALMLLSDLKEKVTEK